MGWTSKKYADTTHTEFTNEDAARFLQGEFVSDGIEFAMVHLQRAETKIDKNEIYCIHRQEGRIGISVIVVDIVDGEIFWKSMGESAIPRFENCPEEFFKFVPAADEGAITWRRRCSENNVIYNPVKW